MKKIAILFMVCLFCCCLFACNTYEPEPVAVTGLTVHFFANTEEHWYPKSPAIISDKNELLLWKSHDQRYWDGDSNEIYQSEISDLVDSYDAEFFNAQQLLLIRFAEGSSGYRHKVTKFEYKENTIFVDITRYVPGAKRNEDYGMTGDMAYWLVLIELDTKYPADTYININGNGNGITAPKEFEFVKINNDKEYEVSRGESNLEGRVVIPLVYKGLPVTRIGDHAFHADTSLKEVEIPPSVTQIGYSAFYACTWLEKVVLNNVVTIGNHAFGECKSLNDIDLPQSLTSIGEWAFYGNETLTEIIIPSSVKSMGIGAFSSCYNLATVTLNEGLESIGANAFWQNKRISEITLPSTLTAIGKSAFCGFTSEQTIFVVGKPSEGAADTAWNKDWRSFCSATIVYDLG